MLLCRLTLIFIITGIAYVFIYNTIVSITIIGKSYQVKVSAWHEARGHEVTILCSNAMMDGVREMQYRNVLMRPPSQPAHSVSGRASSRAP